MTLSFNLEAVWKKRRSAYFKAVMPYWRYVMSSGGVAMGFAFILMVQGYASLLNHTRAAGVLEPWLPAGAAVVLLIALLWNPVRSYLIQPDLLFLLPMEGRMHQYFRGAWRRGAAMSAAATAAVLVLYWPLYQAASIGTGLEYVLAAGFLLAMKGILYYGAWRERQFRYRTDRWLFLAVKGFAAAVSGYLWLRGGVGLPVLAGLGFVWIAYAGAVRVPSTYALHWERLLTEERRTMARHEAWFGFFVDLPNRAEAYKPRAYLNGLLRWIRYEQKNAYLYMYWRSFLRSSLLVFTIRLLLLEAFLIWMFPMPWVAVMIYAVFAWLIGLQLRGIRMVSTEPLLAVISPLPSTLRVHSLRAVQRVATLAGVLLLALPVAAVAPLLYAAGCALGGMGAAILFAMGRRNGV